MAFRIGRNRAQHVYPTPTAAPLARNYAQGPGANILVEDSPSIVWSIIESGAAGTAQVPITPNSTGYILITGVVEVSNTSEDEEQVKVEIAVDGTPIGSGIEGNYVNGGGNQVTSVPFLILVGPLTLGVTHHISVLVTEATPGQLQLDELNSTLELQEVPRATG